MEVIERPAGYMASTLLPGAIHLSLQHTAPCSAVTAGGCAPGDTRLPPDPRLKYLQTVSPPVEPLLLKPRDMSTITSTIIIITITTTLRRSILNTYQTGEEYVCYQHEML